MLECVKLVLITLAWAILPSDLLSLLGYGVGAGAVNATLRYPYSRQLETEADQVGIQLAAKVCFLHDIPFQYFLINSFFFYKITSIQLINISRFNLK